MYFYFCSNVVSFIESRDTLSSFSAIYYQFSPQISISSSSETPPGNNPIMKKNCRASLSSFSRIRMEASKLNLKEATVESVIPSTLKTSCISLEINSWYISLRDILRRIGAASIMAWGFPLRSLNRWWSGKVFFFSTDSVLPLLSL